MFSLVCVLITQCACRRSAVCGGLTPGKPLCAVSFAEVLHSSDVPGGVVNILTGDAKELIPHMAAHMDVNAVLYCRDDQDDIKLAQESGADNMKI